MLQFFQYYGKFQGARAGLTRLPGWARFVLLVAALPGLILMALSILVFGVSLLALLILTLPAYRLVSVLTGGSRHESDEPRWGETTVIDPAPSPGRRQVDVRIIE